LERHGAKALFNDALAQRTWLKRLYIDGGFNCLSFAAYLAESKPGLVVVVVKRSKNAAGVDTVPGRWVVERKFDWLMQHRRLVGYYEHHPGSVVACIHLALMLRQPGLIPLMR
jgi:transposase